MTPIGKGDSIFGRVNQRTGTILQKIKPWLDLAGAGLESNQKQLNPDRTVKRNLNIWYAGSNS